MPTRGDSLLSVSIGVVTRPVGPADVGELGLLFDTARTTRHCWCMAFCTTRTQFALGWFGGGNQRRFESLAGAGSTPMGVLASQAGEPVGWGACGPRSRYLAAVGPSSTIMANRVEAEDHTVWLLPCLFVRDGSRGLGISHALVGAAVELARRDGATAIEGWPLAAAQQRSAEAFVGREQVFAELGFTPRSRPTPDRVVMRLELDAD